MWVVPICGTGTKGWLLLQERISWPFPRMAQASLSTRAMPEKKCLIFSLDIAR